MKHRDLVTERAAEAAHRLPRQPDFGHEDDGAKPGLQDSADGLEVYQRFAAARDPEQQGAFARVE